MKERVFPLPVGAHARTSRFCSSEGAISLRRASEGERVAHLEHDSPRRHLDTGRSLHSHLAPVVGDELRAVVRRGELCEGSDGVWRLESSELDAVLAEESRVVDSSSFSGSCNSRRSASSFSGQKRGELTSSVLCSLSLAVLLGCSTVDRLVCCRLIGAKEVEFTGQAGRSRGYWLLGLVRKGQLWRRLKSSKRAAHLEDLHILVEALLVKTSTAHQRTKSVHRVVECRAASERAKREINRLRRQKVRGGCSSTSGR